MGGEVGREEGSKKDMCLGGSIAVIYLGRNIPNVYLKKILHRGDTESHDRCGW